MPSLTQNTSSALGQVLASVGAAGNTLTKIMMTLDRLTDAGYSHADTFAMNTELRNRGSIQDTLLDEEKRALERTIERIRHDQQLEAFKAAHPDIPVPEVQVADDKPAKAKPDKPYKRAESSPKAAGTG